ncbi:MAG: hypothetical protein ACJ76N_26455 [Thermoanaerobaculia bacterium]
MTGPAPRHTVFASTRPQGLRYDQLPLRLWRKAKRLGIWNPDDLDFTRDPPLTLEDLPGKLSLLALANGRPGLTRLVVNANGTNFELSNLAGGEERTLDLSTAMQAGDRNILTFEGEGAGAASARVTLTTF